MFEKLAYAGTSQVAGQPNALASLFPLLLILIIFYFLLIRPQQKKQKDLQATIDSLKKGDRVITSGGIIGTISSIQNDYFVLKIGDSESSKLEILKSSISGLRK